jgi:phage FluMu protein Com
MGFFNEDDYKGNRKENRVSRWLSVDEGAPVVVQVLDEHPTHVYTHWMADGEGRRLGFTCLGNEKCPVCQRNNRINWDKDHADYVSRGNRYRVNVLDLTPVIECPECGSVYYETAAPATCNADGCGANLRDIDSEPLMEVRILEKGPRIMQHLDALDNDEHPLTGEVMRLQEFPVRMSARGTGLDKVTTISPQMPRDIDVEMFDKYDLDEVGLTLTADEIEYVMNGGTYSDIFSARSAEEEVEESVEDEEVPF